MMVTTEHAREAWNEIAAGFDQYVTPTNIRIATRALERVGLRADMRFLDVACGTGALSIPAAQLGAEVVATDVSPTMVHHLATRARDAGLSNLQTMVMDGQALDLDDNSFDIAGSQFGVMLFPDLPRGVSEMARVTKPGGRVLIVSFTDLQDQEFLTFFLRSIKASIPDFPGFPTDPPPLPFQVADPEKLRQEIARAGLTDIQVERTSHTMEILNAAHLWNTVTASNPIAATLAATLTEQQRTSARQALEAMLRERSGGSGPAALNNAVHFGIGTKR